MCNISRCSAQPPLSQRATKRLIAEPRILQGFRGHKFGPTYLAAAHGLIYDLVGKSRVAERIDGRGEILC